MKITVSSIQRWHLAAATELALMAWLSLFLAQKGWFRLSIIVPGTILSFVLSFLIFRSIPKARTTNSGGERKFLIILTVLIVLSGLLYLRPHEYIEGGWDPGVYVNTAVNVARTGSLTVHDRVLPLLNPSERSLFYHLRGVPPLPQKYGGFSVIDEDKGIIRPRFYHLYPSLSAILAAFYGAKGVFYVNPILAIGSVIGIFLLGRTLLSPTTGLVAAAILALDPVQVWFSRFPTSEMTAQFFLIAGTIALLSYLSSNHLSYAFISGMCLGVALLARPSNVLILTPALIIAFLCRKEKMFQRKDMIFLLLLCFFALHLTWQSLYFNRLYFMRLYTYMCPSLRRHLLFIGLPILGVVVTMRLWYGKLREKSIRFEKSSLLLKIITVSGLLIITFYGYFVRPKVGSGFDSTNLVELGWFVTPLGLIIGLGGVNLSIFKLRSEKVFPLVLLVVSSILFLYRKDLYPIYPWALRRYVPMVIPGLALYSGIAFTEARHYLSSRWDKFLDSRIIGALLITVIAVLLFFKISSAPMLVTTTDYKGMANFISEMAKQLPEGLFVCEGSWLATPLAYIHGRETLQVSDLTPDKCRKLEKVFLKLLNRGEKIWYIPLRKNPIGEMIDFLPVQSFGVATSVLHRAKRAVPSKMRPFEPEVTIYRIEKAGEKQFEQGESYHIDVGYANFGLSGFYKPYRKGNEFIGRWTFGEGEIFLPWPESGEVRLSICIGGCRPEEMPQTPVRIYLGTKLLAERNIQHKLSTYTWKLNSGLFKSTEQRRMLLRLESSTWSPSEYDIHGYPSNLGIMVSWIEISR
jgi:hypothetical protein